MANYQIHKSILFIIIALSYSSISAQYTVSKNVNNAISSKTRSTNGKPGENYWQNHGDYKIDVTLIPDLDLISGNETITYFNNSSDTLSKIVLSVLSDGYRNDAVRDYNYNRDAFDKGVEISKLLINGIQLSDQEMKRSGTNRHLTLKDKLLPNQSVELEIEWSFIFPDVQIRCGNYGDSTFFVAYFYPRVAVYDDIDGWDTKSYTMMTEFYSDFNNYDVTITVPKDFVIWSTGMLQNPEEVFSTPTLNKYKSALTSNNTINVITKDDIKNGNITLQENNLTYHYTASNVPDFAFATSDKFLWDSKSIIVDSVTSRKTLINAAYRQDSDDYYHMVELEAKILQNFSNRIPGVPYPYPSMTIFNGNAGMEFPMMCNDASQKEWIKSAGLAYHEVAHTYFPFYMGTNERKYAWMDEGWASFLPMLYMNEEDTTNAFDYINSRADRYYKFAGSEGEIPIMTLSTDIKTRNPYRYVSYNKSFFGYYYLYRMLGEDLFKKCLVGYMKDWNGKHPVPYDFFNSFNNFSNQDLTWYWENWFFERSFADQSVDLSDNNVIIVKNIGGLFLPIKIEIQFENGHKEYITKEASIWNTIDCKSIQEFKINTESPITKITLGDKHILDIDQTNNIWEK